jgi:hypothetical protein
MDGKAARVAASEAGAGTSSIDQKWSEMFRFAQHDNDRMSPTEFEVSLVLGIWYLVL